MKGEEKVKYTKPTYETEAIECKDVILASVILDGGATLKEINNTTAQVGASVSDLLGLR